MNKPHNKLVDGFAKVVRYEEGVVWVTELPYASSRQDVIGVEIKETPNTARYSDTARFVGCVINRAMQDRIRPGQHLMLQGLAIPLDRKLMDGEKALVNWLATANQDPRWRQSGIVSYSGPIYTNPEQAHLNRIATVGVWRPDAMTPESGEFAEYLALLEARRERILRSQASGQQHKEILPKLGVMIRFEKAGTLLAYSRALSQRSDLLAGNRGDYQPLSGEDVLREMATQLKRAHARHGAAINISILGWSAVQAGQSIKPFSNFEWSAAFTPIREVGGRPDRFGGHMACKANSAVDLTSTRVVNGESVLQVYANHAASSGRRDITAFAVPSPYNNARLLPGEDLTAIATRRASKESDQKQDADEQKSSLPHPTALAGEGFVDLTRDKRGNLLACLRSSSGVITQLSRDELIRRISLFDAKGLSSQQEKLALNAMDKVHQQSSTRANNTNLETQEGSPKAKVIPFKPQ